MPQQPLSQEQKCTVKIVIPSHISRTYVQNHTEYTFLYSFDIRQLGMEGQPWCFHGEPNAFPVPTLVRYCPSQKSFFNDSEFLYYRLIIDDWLSRVPRNKPIIPCPKIGKGCSQMYVIAPRLYEYLTSAIDKIKYQNIEIQYR